MQRLVSFTKLVSNRDFIKETGRLDQNVHVFLTQVFHQALHATGADGQSDGWLTSRTVTASTGSGLAAVRSGMKQYKRKACL